MKYLVIGNQVIMASEHRGQSAFLKKANKWIEEMTEKGVIDCAYSFPSGGGFFIFNANSHEHLMEILIEFPLRPLSEFEVHAIADFTTSNDIVIKALSTIDD